MIALIQIPYWWHATLFEVLWLAAGVAGGGTTMMNLRDSWKDKPVVDALRNDPAIHEAHWRMIALAAKARTESQWTRLVICGLIVASGVVGVITTNPLRGGTTWTGLVVTLTLISIAALTAARSWVDYRQREEMQDLAMGRSSVLAARLKARARKPPDPQEGT